MKKIKMISWVALAIAMLIAPTAAMAGSPHESQLLSSGSCKFDMYHSYGSYSGTADTENKGGCSEVYAQITSNGSNSSWYVSNSKAVAGSNGSGYNFQKSAAKARVTGGGIGTTWILY